MYFTLYSHNILFLIGTLKNVYSSVWTLKKNVNLPKKLSNDGTIALKAFVLVSP